MRNRITIAMAAMSALALVTGVAWAAMPSAPMVIANEHLIDVSDAGQVVVAQSGAELEIVAVETNSGWTHEVEAAKGREVEADFRSADRRIGFNAQLENGQIRVRVRERTGSTVVEDTSTTVIKAPSSTVDDSTSSTVDDSTSTTVDDSTSTTVDDSTSTTVDDSTSTTLDDSTSTTVDDSTSPTVGDDTTSTTIDDSTSTTMGDAPTGSGSETYTVGGVATVTVSWADGEMSLGSLSVVDGWTIEKKEIRSDRVKLEFGSRDGDAGFEARFDNGSIQVEIDVD